MRRFSLIDKGICLERRRSTEKVRAAVRKAEANGGTVPEQWVEEIAAKLGCRVVWEDQYGHLSVPHLPDY